MSALLAGPWTVWGIAGLAVAGVILRPFGAPEFVWAVAGAVLLVALGLLPQGAAASGVAQGGDVYLFLIGMMLLSEVARQEGLFDWLACHAARAADGSAARLFSLVFAVGVVVTAFLSHDATAVVLTPAVAAVARKARVERPLPILFICAFVANAASFLLPISNPANLVIYGRHMPGLAAWLAQYGLASALCLAATYMVLRWRESEWLRAAIARDIDIPGLSPGGSMALIGILATALVLLAASALDLRLGVPTLIAGLVTAALVLARGESGAWAILRGVSWGVLPLVAGLFVLVEALGRTGLVAMLAALLHRAVLAGAGPAAWGTGILLAVSCNLVNNLPAGLVAGHVVDMAPVPARVRAAVLIGVDLGPNLSVTGSLATILWLAALRRDGVRVSAWDFLKSGAVVMPAALLLALAGAFFSG